MDSATVRSPQLEPVAKRVLSIDPIQQTVQTESGMFEYDQLVLATGAKSRGIGTPLKPMSQALLDQIESSSQVTIVGGGKAGVELAFTCARTKDVTLLRKRYYQTSRSILESTSSDCWSKQGSWSSNRRFMQTHRKGFYWMRRGLFSWNGGLNQGLQNLRVL